MSNEVLHALEKLILKLQSSVDTFVQHTQQVTLTQQNSNIVELNVGGTIFATRRETLLSEPDTFFTVLLGEKFHSEKDMNGAYFIDRNPKHFSVILDYLRHGEIDVENLAEKEKKEVVREAHFYQVKSLLALLQEKNVIKQPFQLLPEFCDEKLVLSNDNTQAFRNDTSSAWDCSALCTPGWKNWIVTLRNYSKIMIGVIAKKKFIKDGANHDRGWFLHTASGCLYSPHTVLPKKYVDAKCDAGGTVIEIRYGGGKLSYVVNGKDYGVAFVGLPSDLYPAIEFFSGYSSIEVQGME